MSLELMVKIYQRRFIRLYHSFFLKTFQISFFSQSKKYEKFSNKTLELYSREYDLGRRSLLDLLSAQNDLIGANSQIINANYNILFAKYRILDAMGILV